MTASKNVLKLESALTTAKDVKVRLTRASREYTAAAKQVDTLKKRLDGALQALTETTANLEAQLKAAVASQKAMEAARTKLPAVKTGRTSAAAPAKAAAPKTGAQKVAAKTASAPAKTPRAKAAPKATKPAAKKVAAKKTSTPIGAASGKNVTTGAQVEKASAASRSFLAKR